MNNLKKIFYLLALTLLFSNCGRVDTTIYGSTEKMIEAKSAVINLITAESLGKMIEDKTPGLRIVDVREPDEFTLGHIPGAVNVPRGMLEFSSQLTNRRETICLYSNQQNRSALSADNLKLLKFHQVFVLEGGLDQWKKTFPDQIEEGSGVVATAPAKKASSGGCGD